jgi:hypothetical protein
MWNQRALLAVVVAAAVCFVPAHGAIPTYKPHESVLVFANKVGPYNNPHEIYQYYDLPYCVDDDPEHAWHGLGEVLAGDKKIKTQYEVNFRDNVDWRVLCQKTLKPEQVDLFRKAVEEEYYFEMHVNDLPIWGYIGDFEDDLFFHREEKSHHFIYTHLDFDFAYNGEHIVGVNISSPHKYSVDLPYHKDIDVTFTYSVRWHKSNVQYKDRMNVYHQSHFLPEHTEIHWLSIINSVVLVILLVSFLGIILMRILKNDCTRYMAGDDEDELGEDDSGWKLIHGDVFRFPSNPMLFSAAVGAGAQLLATAFSVLLLALLGVFQATKRGSISTAGIIMYSVTSSLAGFVSARLYRQMKQTEWVWNTLTTVTLFPLPIVFVFLITNSIAWGNKSTSALPFGTIVLLLAIYGFVCVPMCVVGSIAGRNTAGDFDAPCRTLRVARQIPDVPAYRSAPAHVLVAGFLPFSAIYIELHYIFASMWGHRVYTLFGILFIAMLLLTLVSSFITIAMTYFQLAVEDHKWWWRSFVSGGSTGLFIYAYCFHYYQLSGMTGAIQTAFFFGYMSIMAYAFFLALGSVGFYSSLIFVRAIYSAIKSD